MSQLHKIQKIRKLTENTFVLQFERKNIDFIPGQYMSVGPANYILEREYSIYSGIHDPFIEILIREVSDGDVTVKLKNLKVGDLLKVTIPEGSMVLSDSQINDGKFVFIATGTGIAPFRSFLRSYPNLDYKIIHGVRYYHQAYDRVEYSKDRYILCTSGDKSGDFPGRLTKFLLANEMANESFYFLCGNSSMIYDGYRVLREKGVDESKIFSEVYF